MFARPYVRPFVTFYDDDDIEGDDDVSEVDDDDIDDDDVWPTWIC